MSFGICSTPERRIESPARRARRGFHMLQCGNIPLLSSNGARSFVTDALCCNGPTDPMKGVPMAETDLHPRFLPAGWRRDLDLYLAERAGGMNAYMIARHRLVSVARLHGLTDAELAGMGLHRRDIPAFVFEDVLPG